MPTPDPPIPVAVSHSSPEFRARAEALAAGLSLPLAEPGLSLPPAGLKLVVGSDGLALEAPADRAIGRVRFDFVVGKMAHRRRFGGGRGQPLARAIGLKQGRRPTVLDATAGTGRDGFVLATLGCRVRLLERSPIVAALLQDALERAAGDADVLPVVERMTLVNADTGDYLETLPESARPDVIYMDPMYPHRTKTALVKKEMRVLRLLAGDDEGSPGLLALALAAARQRVVVKRPASAGPLEGPPPTMAIKSPNTRYDVYVTKS